MAITLSILGLEGQTPLVMGRVVGLVRKWGSFIINSLLMGRFGGLVMVAMVITLSFLGIERQTAGHHLLLLRTRWAAPLCFL